MKKVLTILIMFMFLATVLSVSAKDDEDGKIDKLKIDKFRVDKILSKEKARAILYKNDCEGEDCKSECKDDSNCPKEFDKPVIKLIKTREISKEKLEQAKERYESARENLKKAKEQAEEKRKSFTEKKEELKTCTLSDCQRIRTEVRTEAKEYVFKTGEKLISILEKTKSRIETTEDIDDDEAASMIARIDERIELLQSATTGDDTKEDILKSAKKVKEEWQKEQHMQKLRVEKLKNAKIGNIIKRAAHLSEKLEKIADKIESDEIKALVGVFNEKIKESTEKQEMAKELFLTAKETNSRELVKQAQQYHKEAQKALKEAHNTLKQIVRLIKGVAPSRLDSDVKDEVETEPEIEDTISTEQTVPGVDVEDTVVDTDDSEEEEEEEEDGGDDNE